MADAPLSDDPWVRAAQEAVRRFEEAPPSAPPPADVYREVPVDVFDDAARDQVRAIGYLDRGLTSAPQPYVPPPGYVPVVANYRERNPAPPASIAYSGRTLGCR